MNDFMHCVHKGLRMDNGKEVEGFLCKEWGLLKIITEHGEAVPIAEATIYPASAGEGMVRSSNIYYKDKEQIQQLQNVVLISRGCYDQTKHKTVLEALVCYWAFLAGLDKKYITTDDILRCLVFPACELFLTKEVLLNIFYENIFKNMIVFQSHNEMTREYLIDILTSQLSILPDDKIMAGEWELPDGYVVV